MSKRTVMAMMMTDDDQPVVTVMAARRRRGVTNCSIIGKLSLMYSQPFVWKSEEFVSMSS
jgi:hypothetical protein